MSKKFLIAITTLLIAFVSCCSINESDYREVSHNVKIYNFKNLPALVYVVTIDSCEYVTYRETLVHKHNCRFCEERKNRESSLGSTIEKISDLWN